MSGSMRYGAALNEGSNARMPCKVSVCTSALPYNVEGFISELQVRYPHLDLDVQYFELPYNDIDHFSVKGKGMDVMILCHSIDNRRFSITDVDDAIYQKFLPKAAKTLGKRNVCVIVHDFPPGKELNNPDKYMREMATFKNKQWTTFNNATLVMICGKLTSEGPVEVQESNWDELEKFLQNATEKKPHSSDTRYSTSVKENKFSSFALLSACILFLASLSGVLYYVIVITSSTAVTTTILPGSTTGHPKTTVPSTAETHVSSQGTSPPPTTIPSLTNQTTESTTEITSSIPTTITDTTPNSTTPSEQTLGTSPPPTTIPPIPPDQTSNSTNTNETPPAA